MPYREVDTAAIESDSSTTSSILRIPLPPGTPPPLATVTSEAMDKADRGASSDARSMQNAREHHAPGRMASTQLQTDGIDTKPIMEETRPAQTSYSSEPVMKDLRKEALAFIPTNLKRKSAAMQKQRQVDPLDIEAMEEQELSERISLQQNTGTSQEPAQPARRRINAAPDV